jgi:hypothetical protein
MYKYIKIRIIFRYCLPIMCSIYINYISGTLNDRTSYIVNILIIILTIYAANRYLDHRVF